MKVNRKDTYFIWVNLKNKNRINSLVKVSLGKYVAMFRHDYS